jgi:hypothetical protein
VRAWQMPPFEANRAIDAAKQRCEAAFNVDFFKEMGDR